MDRVNREMDRMSTNTEIEEAPQAEKSERKKSRGLWWKLILIVLIGMAVCSYFLPQILSQPGVLAGVLNTVYDTEDAEFEIKGVNLGWGLPIQLSGLVIRDKEGDVLTLGTVATTASLWDMIQQKSTTYDLVIDQPHLNLIIDEEGTNVERLLERLSKSGSSDEDDDDRGESSKGVYNVRVTNGSAHVEDRVQGEKVEVSNVGAVVNYSSTSLQVSAKANFEILHNGQSGQFVLALDPVEKGYKFLTQTGDVPLALFAPLIEMELPGLNLRGILNGSIEGVIPTDTQPTGEMITVDLSIRDMEVSGEDYVGQSIFSSSEMKLRGNIVPQTMAVDLTSEMASWALDEPVAEGSKERKRVWSNSASQVSFKGQYASENDALFAEVLRMDSLELAFDITGNIKECMTRQVFDLRGRLAVDQRLLDNAMKAKLTSYNLRVDSLQTGEFRLEGPLWTITPASADGQDETYTLSPEFAAATRVNWKNVGFETFDLGPGTMDVTLKNNVLGLTPTPLNLLGGRVDLTSAFDITNPDDPIIMIPAGVKIENAGINTELSRRWLAYVSPLFAEATAIEGKFTLELPNIKARLSELTQQQMQLVLTFHKGRLGPGPLMQQISGMIAQMQSTIGREPGRGVGGLVGGLLQPDVQWIGVPEQRVTLVINNGKVAHQNLVYQIGDVQLVSSGSVGSTDGRLNLNFAMGIPDAWTRNKPLLAGMAGQVINIGVGGTLGQPEVDLRNLAAFGKQIGAGAIGGLIDNLIERRRNR